EAVSVVVHAVGAGREADLRLAAAERRAVAVAAVDVAVSVVVDPVAAALLGVFRALRALDRGRAGRRRGARVVAGAILAIREAVSVVVHTVEAALDGVLRPCAVREAPREAHLGAVGVVAVGPAVAVVVEAV